MIVGLGTDIVLAERMEKAVQNARFVERCFTCGETDYLKNKKKESYAGIFAAKEAAVKALGTGFSNGIRPVDIEVCHDENGKPRLVFHKEALKAAAALGAVSLHISISHERCYAVAVCILEN